MACGGGCAAGIVAIAVGMVTVDVVGSVAVAEVSAVGEVAMEQDDDEDAEDGE